MAEFKMDDIDIAGQKTGLAVTEVHAPQAAETLVEAERGNFGQLSSKAWRHSASVRA